MIWNGNCAMKLARIPGKPFSVIMWMIVIKGSLKHHKTKWKVVNMPIMNQEVSSKISTCKGSVLLLPEGARKFRQYLSCTDHLQFRTRKKRRTELSEVCRASRSSPCSNGGSTRLVFCASRSVASNQDFAFELCNNSGKTLAHWKPIYDQRLRHTREEQRLGLGSVLWQTGNGTSRYGDIWLTRNILKQQVGMEYLSRRSLCFVNRLNSFSLYGRTTMKQLFCFFLRQFIDMLVPADSFGTFGGPTVVCRFFAIILLQQAASSIVLLFAGQHP